MYDLEEQEKIDAMKAWWAQYGKLAWVAILVLVGAYAGWKGWRHHLDVRAEEAAVMFEAASNAAQQGDPVKTLQAAQRLQEAQPDSGLAARAALISATVSHAHSDEAGAMTELDWVVTHASEPELADLARLRKAGLLADEKKYSDALALLEANHQTDFMAMTADLKGDIYLAQGRSMDARMAYKMAMEKAAPNEALRQIAQIKLDALGVSP